MVSRMAALRTVGYFATYWCIKSRVPQASLHDGNHLACFTAFRVLMSALVTN